MSWLFIARRLTLWKKNQEGVTRLMAIPGAGILTATAIIATVGDMKTFRSGREFAVFLGSVPRQSGTGGKARLLGISKRRDTYLRLLLTHWARVVVNFQIRNRNPWIDKLLSRRPHNVVVVAQANKMARTIWALPVKNTEYVANHGMNASAVNVQPTHPCGLAPIRVMRFFSSSTAKVRGVFCWARSGAFRARHRGTRRARCR